MPIITKPALIQKGVESEFTLDKTALALHPIVVASPDFSSPNTWSKVDLKYKSSVGGQFDIVEFDASLASPIAFFYVSSTARNLFQVEKITIIDHDGAVLVIPREDLIVAEFDIEFFVAPSNLSYTSPVIYTQNVAITNNLPTVTGGGLVYTVSPALPSGLTINSQTGIISGTPLVTLASSNYTVTATNNGGSTTAVISISVIDQFDYITYSFATTQVLNNVGGVSGGDGTTIKSVEGKSNNFELNFLFNLNSHVLVAGQNVIFGAEQHDVFRTNSNPRFTGFILSNAASGLQVYNDGAVVFSTTVSSIPSGDNFFKIIRNNGVLQFKLNSTVLHTVSTLSHLDIEMFATVAVRGNVELKQSYYSTTEENEYYFNNTYKAPNLLVTDGGKSLEVSYAQNYGTALISAPVHEFASKSYYFEFNVVSLAAGSQISFGYRKTSTIGPVVANLSSATFYLGAHSSSGNVESRIYYQNSRMYFSTGVLANTIPAFSISQGDNIGILRMPQVTAGHFTFRIVKNGTVVGTYTNTSGGSNRFEYFAVQLQTVGDKVTINDTPVYTLPANTIYVKPS